MFKSSLVAICSLCLLWACTELENPKIVASEKKVVLIIPSLPQDSTIEDKSTLVTIIARIPEAAGRVDIAFSTTAGVFMETNDKTVKQIADRIDNGFRYASVVLITDTVKTNGRKIVYIAAEALTDRDRMKIYFKKKQ